MWYFPIIPRLQRLFKIQSISEDLRWHATRRTGVLRHPADSQEWRTIDEKFPKIAEDLRNLGLGISADGVDVNTGNRHHSVWPVLTVIYNLPPWLCMKRKCIMLSVLILGYSGNDINVFLEPLVDDLHTLFETGVDTYDVFTKDNFNLRAIVLWIINDYPVLGTLCGCPYSGFKGCVVCGKDTNCVRLSALSKQSYVGHRRYLPYNHPFRKQKKAFNRKQEFLPALIPITRKQIYNEVQHIENKWRKGKRTNNKASENQEDMRGRGGKIQKQKRNTTEEEGSSSQVNGQNKKNVAESLVGTLLHVSGKMKDGVNARLDLAKLGGQTRVVCYARRRQNNTTSSSKEIILQELDKMQAELVVTLCLLEKFFPLSFFDIMIHLTVHLTKKLIYTCNEIQVERELAISKESVSETVRWISYGPRATVVKYDAYNINGYTFCTKCHDGKVYQNSGVSVEAIDLHISKEVATIRQAFYYGVLQEIWVLDYRFRKIPLFKCDWVNHRAGGVKRDNLGYTLVDLNNLGYKVDLNNLGHKTPPKNYKDTYDEVDEEFSTVIHQRNDNILPCVNRRDLGNES
ncbi:putative transposase-associated domain-containing protein [Tanacetum coccineum]